MSNILKEKDIVCPERVVAALFESHAMIKHPEMDEKVEIMKIINLYKNIINTKYLGFNSFIKVYGEIKTFQESIQALEGILER